MNECYCTLEQWTQGDAEGMYVLTGQFVSGSGISVVYNSLEGVELDGEPVIVCEVYSYESR